MSYEDYPDEFQILKGSLENEDYDRAESVLLMILQKRPDFQQAKLDLERVRGKLGSISNYEFRVRAFIDQGDLRTAGEIVAEATTRFQKNRKIKQLIEYFKDKAGQAESAGVVAAEKAAADAQQGAVPPDDDVLPNLETFTAPADAEAFKKAKENFQKMGAMPGAEPGAAGGLAAPPSGDAPGVPASTALRSRRETMRAEAAAGATTGARKRGSMTGEQIIQRRTARAEETLNRDAGVAGGVALLVIAVLVVLAVVLAGASGAAVAGSTSDKSALGKAWTDALGKWSDTSEDNREKLLARVMQEKDVQFVDAMYFTLMDMRDSDEVIRNHHEELYNWRLRVRRDAGLHTPVDPAGLVSTEWQPEAFPPQYGTGGLQSATFSMLLTGLLISVVPGILLGAVLAWCRMPLANRIFQFVWEVWYAVPAVALLYLGLWWLAPAASGPIAGTLLGVAMIPHIAFYCRQGFENIVGRSAGVSLGLAGLVIVSALLASAGRFAAEGVLVYGVTQLAEDPAPLQPVHTMGREIFAAVYDLAPGMVVRGEPSYELRFDLAVYMAFWVFLASLILSLLAQLLQAAVAWEGLKMAEPQAPGEQPEHRSQSAFGLRNLGMFGLGLVISTLVLVLALAAVGSTGADAEPGSGWTDQITKAQLEAATSDTLVHAGTAGAIGAVLGFLLIVPTLVIVDTRRIRALIDCAFRIPVGIPPLAMVVLCIGILKGMNIKPDQWVSAIVIGLILAPLGAAMLYAGWSQYRRGPYVYDRDGFRPKNFGLWFARLLEFIGVGLFLAAITAGSVTLVAAFGGSVGAVAKGQFSSLSVWLMELMRQPNGYLTEAAHSSFMALLKVIVGLLALGFVAKLAAEVMARFALLRRGRGVGLEDWDG